MIDNKGLTLNLTFKSPYRPTDHRLRLTFAENMASEVTIEGQRELLTLFVDVEISREEFKGFVGRLSGTIYCSKLSTDQLLITDGTFDMFKGSMSKSSQSTMEYRFTAVTRSGKEYHLVGTKTIDPSVTLSVPKLWRATTTLYLVIKNEEDFVVGSERFG